MQMEQDRLKSENQNLVTAFREKSRKHQQTQELYDRLKRKEMTAATQSAAFESVEDVLGNTSSRHAMDNSAIPQHHRSPPRGQISHDFQSFGSDPVGQPHHRTGSGHSQGSAGLLHPQVRRTADFDGTTFGLGH